MMSYCTIFLKRKANYYDDLTEELRLFHFFKSNTLSEGINYPFLAVLYGPDFKEENYYPAPEGIFGKRDIIGIPGNELKESFGPGIIDNNDSTLYFQDAFLLEIKAGEPEDPNELKITDICSCGGDYVVSFNLKFCNVSETGDATGATVVLEDIEDVFSCIEFENITPSSECNSCFINCCTHEFNGIGDTDESKRFCFRFPDDPLKRDKRCAYVNFSARISALNIDKLWQQAVFKYCVILHSGYCESKDEITDIVSSLPSNSGPLSGGSLEEFENKLTEFGYEISIPKYGEVCDTNCLLDTLKYIQPFVALFNVSGLSHFVTPNEKWVDKYFNKCNENESCHPCCKDLSCYVIIEGWIVPISVAVFDGWIFCIGIIEGD